MIDLNARTGRSRPAAPAPAGPRLPARLRGRRPLVLPPALASRLDAC